jgi:hypothetical protein
MSPLDGADHSQPPDDVRSLDSGRDLIFSGRLPALATHFTTERSADLSVNRRRVDSLPIPSGSRRSRLSIHFDRNFLASPIGAGARASMVEQCSSLSIDAEHR